MSNRDVLLAAELEVDGGWLSIFLDALRRDAGVMLGDSSSESGSSAPELDVGVLGRFWGGIPFLPVPLEILRPRAACTREVLLIGFRAPGFVALRWKLTVVSLVDLTEGNFVCRNVVVRERLETLTADRFRARSSREAICCESLAASSSARSWAAFDRALAFFAFAEGA
jgi:hypothetical protein